MMFGLSQEHEGKQKVCAFRDHDLGGSYIVHDCGFAAA